MENLKIKLLENVEEGEVVEIEDTKQELENEVSFSIVIWLYGFLLIFNICIIELSTIIIQSERFTTEELKSHLYLYMLGYTLLHSTLLIAILAISAMVSRYCCKLITLEEEKILYQTSIYLWFLNGGTCTLIGPYWCYLGITRGQLSMSPF